VSDVVGARQQLRQIAIELKQAGRADFAGRVEDIVSNLLHRRPAVRRAPTHSAKVTLVARQKVVDLATTTDLHSSEITAALGLNPARVSEILQGDK